MVIAHGDDREQAITHLSAALSRFEIAGVKHNIPFIQAVLADNTFIAGDVHTDLGPTIATRK